MRLGEKLCRKWTGLKSVRCVWMWVKFFYFTWCWWLVGGGYMVGCKIQGSSLGWVLLCEEWGWGWQCDKGLVVLTESV